VITISPACPHDAPAMATLLAEMDRFYGATSLEPADQRIRQISEALFTDPPAGYALLARDGPQLAGIAAYSFLWPAVGLTRSLYLKELYVDQAHRYQGAGRLLMRAIFQTAAQHACSRVEWTTDNDNTSAQAFYDTLGLPPRPAKVFYRAEGTRIRTYNPGKADANENADTHPFAP
jgi:GNAT superfamily N-acetyltransferase